VTSFSVCSFLRLVFLILHTPILVCVRAFTRTSLPATCSGLATTVFNLTTQRNVSCFLSIQTITILL
jgi:hypothetical protein